MKYTTKIVASSYEIEKEILLRYGIGIYPIANLFWEGEYQDNCYKQLFFSEAHIREAQREYEILGDTEANERVIVLTTLRDIFPDHTSIIVDVSW